MLGPMLKGVTVIDLTRYLAGPYCSMTLGDLGADILKIEKPGRGDPMRLVSPPFVKENAAYFLSVNKNKQSITLALDSDEGRAVFFDLVKSTDVVVENFRPGVADKIGIGYDACCEVNPKIVYCALSAFGETGPYREHTGFDIILQALSGVMSLNGLRDDDIVKHGIPIADLGGGLFAALGIVSALFNRSRTGQGRKIDLAILDTQVSLLTYFLGNYSVDKQIPGPQKNDHPNIVPYGLFRTKNIPLVVAVLTDKAWDGFCRAIDEPELARNPRYETNVKRREHKEELKKLLREKIERLDGKVLFKRLREASVPAAPVKNLDDICSDEQVLFRKSIRQVKHPDYGEFTTASCPIKTSGETDPDSHPPPLLGEHTESILKERLQYSADKIARLKKKSVI
ncbi:MAG: CoA transferase [Desulfatiglans sp.]|jgi:crotonobetainyl-CoA:carnitine CoA-transferase CaiB-like acyl-CoA transferase|nr:CoA transferase [Desulfatiglans sp.]